MSELFNYELTCPKCGSEDIIGYDTCDEYEYECEKCKTCFINPVTIEKPIK